MTTAHHKFLTTISGPTGSELLTLNILNTAAAYTVTQTTLTTNGITGAATFVLPSSASSGVRQVFIIPPATNRIPMRIGNSTAGTSVADHLAISSNAPTILSLTTGISTLVLWTTGTTATIPDVRVIVV